MLLSAQIKLKENGGQALSLLLSISITALTGLAQGGPKPPAEAERKVELVSSAEAPAQPERRRILERRVRRPWGLRIVDVLKFPLNQFGKALDAAARKVEKDHALERAQDLQVAAIAKGYEPLFGGLGTGSGFAFGVYIARKDFLGTGWQLDVPIEYSTNLFNFEYRWWIWRFTDLIMFFDEGQVAAETGDFSLSELDDGKSLTVMWIDLPVGAA